MNDALTFSNGYSSNPNQILGMYLADYNFHRVGNILADLPDKTRTAFQYLIRGLTVDENSFVKSDGADQTNKTQVDNKSYRCLNAIASFLPDSMPKIKFDDFAAKFRTKLRVDYVVRKALVEVDNRGLSKRGARVDFEPVNSASDLFLTRNRPKPGYWEGTALFYLFYLMDLPSQDFNTAIARGTNVPIDNDYVLSGSTSIVYGNAARCFTLDGKAKHSLPRGQGSACDSGGADEFFTQYLPARFYPNPAGSAFDQELRRMTCDELARRSKAALASYFAGR